MNDFTGRVRPDEWTPPVGSVRTVTVALDTAQYQVRQGYAGAGWGGQVSHKKGGTHLVLRSAIVCGMRACLLGGRAASTTE